jgi:Sec-independent protein translocase protein TatA
MARDLGRFVTEARRSIDEFKEELTASEDDDEDEAESKDRPKHSEKQYDEEDEHDL